MDNKRLYILGEMPVPKAILKLAVPTILSMIVAVFYNLTDTFFVGKLNDPYQVAAVTITLPIFMMQMALSGIFGNGAASYISRLLGEKNYAGARTTATLAWLCTAIVSVLVSILGIVFLSPILKASGASEHTFGYASSYLTIIFAGSIISMLNFTTSQMVRAEGAAKYALMGMLLGTGTNIVLDPIFILWMHQGVKGAAIATIIGNSVALLYYVYFYLSGKSLDAPGLKYIKLHWHTLQEIVKIGVPSSLSQLMMSVGNAISYHIAAGYGDNTVAAMGVAMRVFTIPIFVFIGLAIGVQPLIGYSYGAGNNLRLKHVLNTAIAYALALSGVFTILFALFSKYTMIIFIKNPEVVAIGSQILRVYTFGIIFAAVQMQFGTGLQAMGKGMASFILSISRMGLIYIPAIILLNKFFGFNGMIYAMPLTDFLTTGLAFGFIYKILVSVEKEKETV
jgi:putative MATE family efflux protein